MNKPNHNHSDPSPPIESLVEQVQSGSIGRRDFLRRAVTAGVSSAVAYSLLGQATASAQNVTTYAVGEEGQPPTQVQPPALGKPTTTRVGEENTSPPVTTYAEGEENTGPPATTQAFGEETQPTYSYGEGQPSPTTYAVGEETQPTYSYGEGRPSPTTYAVGEEQPPNCNRPPTTTRAYGEEVQVTPPPTTTQAVGEEGRITTYSHGEEGNVAPPTTWSTGEENSRISPTTQAVGEEGNHQGTSGKKNQGSSSPQRRIQSTIRKQLPKVWKGFGRW